MDEPRSAELAPGRILLRSEKCTPSKKAVYRSNQIAGSLGLKNQTVSFSLANFAR